MNIDSDTDEWQGSNDCCEGELGMREEEEDSVIESPLYGDSPGYELTVEDVHEYDGDDIDETIYNDGCVDSDGSRGFTNVPEAYTGKCIDSNGSDFAFQFPEKTLWKERGDHNVQNDSCMSSDIGATAQGSLMKAESSDNRDHWPRNFNSLYGGGGHVYVLEPCGAKVWSTGYMTCPKNEIDFLSTCSMIAEVFGDGDWDLKARDWEDLF